MAQANSLSRLVLQNHLSLAPAIATLITASTEELTSAIKELPPEKRRQIATALLMNTDLAEKTEIFQQLSLEKTGEVAMAIAQVWQVID